MCQSRNKLPIGNFKWQQSASAFSVQKHAIDRFCKYILNPAEHHKKESFEDEHQKYRTYYQKTLKQ